MYQRSIHRSFTYGDAVKAAEGFWQTSPPTFKAMPYGFVRNRGMSRWMNEWLHPTNKDASVQNYISIVIHAWFVASEQWLSVSYCLTVWSTRQPELWQMVKTHSQLRHYRLVHTRWPQPTFIVGDRCKKTKAHPLSAAAGQCCRWDCCRSSLHPGHPRRSHPAWAAAPQPTATTPSAAWPHTGPASHKWQRHSRPGCQQWVGIWRIQREWEREEKMRIREVKMRRTRTFS